MVTVGRHSLLVAALLQHLVTTALAAKVAEAAASLSSVGRAGATLHTHAEKMADTAGRLLRGRSSHGMRANVFRTGAGTGAHSAMRLDQPLAPLYVPKMSLANVTAPTPFPPPPPVLHPWKDMQPLDTAVGNYIISGFIAQPTVTPPPSQSSLDLAFGCPALLTWPKEATVSAPDACSGNPDGGNWTGPGGAGLILDWASSCLDTTNAGAGLPTVHPLTVYRMENGDLFGTSQETSSMSGRSIELRDCGGATAYTIEEKIYKQAGQPDPDACAKYHSCDGIVYFQYFMKNAAGKLIALTGYTTIFQDSFSITDPAGGLIAEVARLGWQPQEKVPCEQAKPHVWNLKYASSPPGPWAVVTAQWPIAMMMTMLSQRDESRQPNGQVLWNNCEVLKTTGYVATVGISFLCFICIPMAIFLVCSAPILRFLGEAEEKLFPRRMGKPGNYA